MEIDAIKTVKVNARVLKIHMKVSDTFSATLEDQDGVQLHEQEDGYVPDFMPGRHYGDYVILDIDIDTGQVLNWDQPSAEQIQKWIRSDD